MTQMVKRSLIVFGKVRDKLQLIRMASFQAKQMFPVLGNADVIDISPYNQEIGGYVVVVEFEVVKDREVVAVKSSGEK